MTLVLDARGISALVARRARLIELRRRRLWPPRFPRSSWPRYSPGTTATNHANRLLRVSQIRDVTEPCAHQAARYAPPPAGPERSPPPPTPSSPLRQHHPPVVGASDPSDLAALAQHATRPITIAPV